MKIITSKIISALLSLIMLFPFFDGLYEKRELFSDTGFEHGFSVMSQQTKDGAAEELGNFVYNPIVNEPMWMIAQWNSGNCLWADRVQSDKYTITDGKTKTVKFNPADNSVSLCLNAANVYLGEPAGEESWPHLLLEQSPIPGYSSLSEQETLFYRCDSDKLTAELKIRLSDFSDTTNENGINAAQFLAYFYLRGYNGKDFVWFGINLFDSRGLQDANWSRDTAGSNQMIYSISTADTYGVAARSLFRYGKPYVSEKWTVVKVDLREHIEKMLMLANADNTFGRQVSASDFYVAGTNIGFEIHGNYGCTVDIKDYSLTSVRFAKR